MSFYTKIKTKLSSKRLIICALEEMKRKGEIASFVENEKKERIEVDRDGDKVEIIADKAGEFEVAGDNRVIQQFSNRLKQVYAYETIKDNLPLDFEIAQESESGGEITILLKG